MVCHCGRAVASGEHGHGQASGQAAQYRHGRQQCQSGAEAAEPGQHGGVVAYAVAHEEYQCAEHPEAYGVEVCRGGHGVKPAPHYACVAFPHGSVIMRRAASHLTK